MIEVVAPLAVIAIAGVGLGTLLVWVRRLGGEDRPTPALAATGTGVLFLAVALGLAAAAVEIVGALGLA